MKDNNKQTTSLFLDLLGYSPTTKVLNYFLTWRMYDFTMADISEYAEVSRKSAKTVMTNLLKQNVIKITRTIGPATLYTLNKKDIKTTALEKLFEAIVKDYIKKEGEEQ